MHDSSPLRFCDVRTAAPRNVTSPLPLFQVTGAVEQLNRIDGTWDADSWPALPQAAMSPSGALDPDGNVVVVGGFDQRYFNSTYVLDTKAKTWAKAADFPFPRSALECASTSAGVLCFGGCENDPAYSDSALFDGKSWKSVTPMHDKRSWFGATDFSTTSQSDGKEYVYAIGGYCNKPPGCFFDPIPSVERYDVDADLWEEVEELPMANAGNVGATCRGKKAGCADHTVITAGGGSVATSTQAWKSEDPGRVL